MHRGDDPNHGGRSGRRDRRAFLAAASTAAVAALAGCSRVDADGEDEEDYDIGMSANRFLPAEYETTVGSTVVWRNTGSRAHSVTAYEDTLPEGAEFFASGGYDGERAARDGWVEGAGGRLFGDEVYEHTFTVPGRYGYFCIPHEPGGMVGTIVVTE